MTPPLSAAAFVLAAALSPADYAFFHENVLGTSFELRVRAESPEAAARAEATVLREIDRLSSVFSGYDPASEFSRWEKSHGTPVRVSRELAEVLRASDRWRVFTSGAFDPRAQAFSLVWSAAARRGSVPTTEEVAAAKSQLGTPAWRIEGETAERTSACPLTLNAIAKGYIVDLACDAALDPDHGVSGLLVAIGGDMRAVGDLARKVGSADPRRDSETTEPLAYVDLRGRALATSGGYQRGFDVAGRRYSHVIDPRIGRPASRVLGASVVADRAVDADALATAFGVLEPEESVRLADSLPGVACLVVTDDRVVRSRGWKAVESPMPVRVSLVKELSPTPSWADDFEVAVKYEIKGPDANPGRYRRPYVAVWVEDADGVPVRTLTLWVQSGGPGPRWIPDLKLWYRGDQLRKLVDEADLVRTVSRATRPPGKYEVVWDGKDDHGKAVEPGKYTLSIEAAREHGTYQIIRKPITVGGAPFLDELKGNAEVKAVSVEYRRRKAAK